MAAQLLHRLQQVLSRDGGREGPAGGLEQEDCPESSELEDDTEGLSTRLSGTLSFTGSDDDAETPEGGPAEASHCGDPSPPLAEHQGSNLLTRQLQELWQKSRSTLMPQRLLFEVTSTTVVSERNSKYVRSLSSTPST